MDSFVKISYVGSRWFNITIVIFWLASMTWLVKQKVLPPLFVGEPPTYRTVLDDQEAPSRPISWRLSLNDQLLGWATSQVFRLDNGVAEVRSRVQIDRLPLAEMTPAWIKPLLQRVFPSLTFSMKADGNLQVDPLGRPIGFYSKASFREYRKGEGPKSDSGTMPAEMLAPPRSIGPENPDGKTHFDISLQGTVEGRELKLKVKSGDFIYNTTAFLPSDALLGDALAPQGRLPGLRVGQSWTMPVYSPLSPPASPMEILHAQVERQEPIRWQSRVVSAFVVVFRSDSGGGLTNSASEKAKAWVDAQGNVLKQEMTIGSARLSFERLP